MYATCNRGVVALRNYVVYAHFGMRKSWYSFPLFATVFPTCSPTQPIMARPVIITPKFVPPPQKEFHPPSPPRLFPLIPIANSRLIGESSRTLSPLHQKFQGLPSPISVRRSLVQSSIEFSRLRLSELGAVPHW